jgi:benzil reductase ((S)-benzoin forming)
MKNLIVITGASKGLGEGIAMALLNPDNHIICVSRSKSQRLQDSAIKKGCLVEFKHLDLSIPEGIKEFSREIFQQENENRYTGILLVNNAGVVEPVGPAGLNDNLETIQHLNINLLSPMLLVSEFIRVFGKTPAIKRVINISSGAANSPYEGWSVYCTGKAGLDMFTRCVAKEQETKEFPVEIMSVAPGVIDTDMQKIIRSTRPENFIHRKRFVKLKESGSLVHPDVAGTHIAQLLLANQFQNGAVVDIRDNYQNQK